MQKEYNIYTGTLKYKEIEFTFVFSNDELCLIPPKEASHKIQFEWLMKKTGPGVYTMGDLLRIEDAYLIGRCNENGQNMIFFPEPCSLIGSRNSVLYVEIRAYIVCKFASEYVSQLSFSSPEINYIHPNNLGQHRITGE